jgi:FkbM family methyltransferase
MKLNQFGMVNGHTIVLDAIGSHSTVVDLGANRGGFSQNLKKLRGGRYYLVEANPVLFEKLDTTSCERAFHCAVADKEGSIEFNISLNDEGSSILALSEQSAYGATFCSAVEVRARTIPSLLAEIGAERIDLLKMDIEGAEVPVLETIEPAELARLGQITIEFHCDPLFPFGLNDRTEAVVRRLESLGFVCLDFTCEVGWKRRDVLFLNRQMHGLTGFGAWWLKARVGALVFARHLYQLLRFTLGPAKRRVAKSFGA